MEDTRIGTVVSRTARKHLDQRVELQQIEYGTVFALYLLRAALRGIFLGAPPQELGSVTKAASSKVIELNLGDELRLQRLPFRRTLGAPAAGTAWGIPSAAGRLDQFLQTLGKCWAILGGD